jgi:ferrochelatase
MTDLSGQTDATREGVVLVALGSPVAPTEEAIGDFLSEFLSDPRVVDLPRALWLPILNGPVRRRRPARVLGQYEGIWTEEGSPLRVHTRAQGEALARLLPGRDVRVAYQYGSPNVADVFLDLARSCDVVTVLPAYPHFAPATVGSIADRVRECAGLAAAEGHRPRIRAARSWPSLAGYVDWHAGRILEEVSREGVDLVVFSWHGVPLRKAHGAARYRAECHATASAVMERVEAQGCTVAWEETFQSKFGPGRWLAPATIDTMPALPGRGVRSVLVTNPGFLADCLETVYEMDVLNAGVFRQAGGVSFRRIAPPDAESAARFLAQVRGALTPASGRPAR